MHLRLSLAALLVSIALAGVCPLAMMAQQPAPQLGQSPQPALKPAPRRASTDNYLRLLDGYRRYDEAAARELEGLWISLYETDAPGMRGLIGRVPSELAPISAMALTDLAMAAYTRELPRLAHDHLRTAEQFIEPLLQKPVRHADLAAQPAAVRFARDWYLAAIWLYVARGQMPLSIGLLERARKWFPDDADILLSSGSFEELTAKQMRRARVADDRLHLGAETLRRVVLAKADAALAYYRAAIANDPDAAEARIRLAYLRSIDGMAGTFDAGESLAMLGEARVIAKTPPLSYLAALFAGQIEETRSNLEAASKWYRTAIADCPRAQTARLAFSHLQLDRSGSVAAAKSTLRPLIGQGPPEDGVCEPDPWRLYDFGQAWRLRAQVEHLRTFVREITPEISVSATNSQEP